MLPTSLSADHDWHIETPISESMYEAGDKFVASANSTHFHVLLAVLDVTERQLHRIAVKTLHSMIRRATVHEARSDVGENAPHPLHSTQGCCVSISSVSSDVETRCATNE